MYARDGEGEAALFAAADGHVEIGEPGSRHGRGGYHRRRALWCGP